jgi:hypothetical protein
MRILLRNYDMTIHAMEEMAEDNLDILDIEHAILNGQIVHTTTRDPEERNSQSKALRWMVRLQ